MAAAKPIYTPAYQFMLSRLRQARRAAGLKQSQVAAHFKRSQSFVSKCESGERRIDPTDLAAFAKIYGEPLTYFLGGHELSEAALDPSALGKRLQPPNVATDLNSLAALLFVTNRLAAHGL
jgi:transcriptional regulator with XRE-family HTH domain